MFAMYLWFQCAVLLAVSVSCIVMASPLVESSSLQQSVGGIIRPMKKSPRYGYDGPTVNEKSFDDIAYFISKGVTVVGICSIDICFGDSVDFIQVTYLLSNGLCRQAPRHGSDSCQPQLHTITLDTQANEYITKIEGSTKGSLVNHLTLHTYRPGYEHRTFGPFGKPGTFNYTIEGFIVGLYGRYENLVRTIGAYYLDSLKQTQLYGVQPGVGIAAGFDDKIDAYVPPIVGISKLYIWHGRKINAFQVEYVLLSGHTVLSEKHGGEGSLPAKLTIITLAKGEQIVKLRGKKDRTYYTYLDEISFITKNKYGYYKVYGPFGYGSLFSDKVEFSGNICGFFGSTSIYVYGFGMYYF
jgi:hypothetical protein